MFLLVVVVELVDRLEEGLHRLGHQQLVDVRDGRAFALPLPLSLSLTLLLLG